MTRADRRAFAIAYAAWLFGIFAYFIPPATWNPVSRFNLTRAVVERRSLQIDPYVASSGDRALVDGHWYSDKAPVPGLLAVPPYAVVHVVQTLRGVAPSFESFGTTAHPAVRVIPNAAFQQGLYVCSLFTSGAAGIALALLLWTMLRRRASSTVAFIASSVTVLGTPIFPYATTFYGHVPAAAFLLGALFALDRRMSPRAEGVPQARVRTAGACLVLAVGCEYLVAVPVAIVALWFLGSLPAPRRARALADIVVGGALPALLMAGYHTVAFGAPWRTGYAFETQAEFISGHASGFMGLHVPSFAGLYGLTLGVRRGLVYVSPIALLALLLAVRHAIRRNDGVARAGLGALLGLFLANAGYYMWWGGAAAGPRHLIPGLAVIAFGLVLLVKARPVWLRYVALALAVASIGVSVAIAAVGVEAPERRDVLKEYLWPQLKHGRVAILPGASNLGLRLGLPGVFSLAPVVAWGALGYLYLLRQLRRGSAAHRFT
jgi:hypothetical protein